MKNRHHDRSHDGNKAFSSRLDNNNSSNLEETILVEHYLRNFERKNKVASSSICEWIFNFSKDKLK